MSIGCLHADLRQILQRTTSIKDLPKNIWKAGNAMTCDADSLGSNLRDAGAAKGRNKLEKSLLSGSASLTVEPIASDPGWVNVQITSKGSGWLGFGVAQAGKRNHGNSVVCTSGHLCLTHIAPRNVVHCGSTVSLSSMQQRQWAGL